MESKYNVSARISKQFKFPLRIIGMFFEPVPRSELLYVSLLENPIDIRRSRLVLYYPQKEFQRMKKYPHLTIAHARNEGSFLQPPVVILSTL